jgi:hypothetical protein
MTTRGNQGEASRIKVSSSTDGFSKETLINFGKPKAKDLESIRDQYLRTSRT